jgi:uncharacterized protein YkwD
MKPLLWSLAVLLIAGFAAAAEPPAPEPPEKELARLLNAERTKEKLPALTWDDSLARVALAHCEDMRDHGFFAHESPRTGKVGDRLTRVGIAYRACAENIARSPTAAQAHANLMASAGHRANILSPRFTHLGIGVLKSQDGFVLVTQVFLEPVPVIDPAALAEQLLGQINEARAQKGLRRLVREERLMRAALEHSQRANRLGKPDPMWLETRLAQLGGRWTLRDGAYFLTEKPEEVVTCPTALSPRYEEVGLGIVQSAPDSKAAGGLWITLLCAQK